MLNKRRLIFIFIFVALSGALWYVLPQTRVLNGYVARTVCSCHFEINRSEKQIVQEDLSGGLFSLASFTIDEKSKSVSSSFFGISKKTAVYRNGLGCILLKGKDDYHVVFTATPDSNKQDLPWQDVTTSSLSREAKNKIDTLAFDESFSVSNKKTRALLILHKDKMIYEQYANGISRNTPLLGWSMTKSVISACAGILTKKGQLSLDERPFNTSSDPYKSNTTLKDLLQMRSGLDWEENYNQYSSATKMLFDSDNVFEQIKKLSFGEKHWEYSSGTTNLISGILKSKFNTSKAYLTFPHTALFHALDLQHAWIEPDESGTYLGSSYMYATGQDWLKLGRLFLKKGNWQGTQLIDSSWIDFVQLEAPGSQGRYGGHFWLNKNGISYPDAPHDMFTMDGYQGQLVAICPTQELVIVRLGLADIDFNQLLKTIINEVEN